MTPERLARLLAEPARMRVFAAVVLGARTPAEIARRTGLAPRAVAGALRRLTEDGPVAITSAGLVAQPEVVRAAARASAPRRDDVPPDPDRDRAAILRAFIVNGRLVTIPAVRRKRRVVLEHVVTAFTPGVRYPEREVDAVLRAWHDDHASLRRLLVDEDLLARDQGVYWRIGGPVLT